jgi:multiple sugar transport system substrate-binding protein
VTNTSANPADGEITSLPWNERSRSSPRGVGRRTPDVVEMPDRWLALYANNGALENLSRAGRVGEYRGGLNERALQFARFVDNTAYMIPYGFYLRAMFYNKKLFEQAGVTAPPKTLDEFRAAAEKVSAIPANTATACAAARAG